MGNIHPKPQPGDPRYLGTGEMVRRELARRAAYEALPSTIAKRRLKAETEALRQADRNAKRKRPMHHTCSDYPWLMPGWKW